MKFVTPEVFHLTNTTVDREGLQALLEKIGAPNWETDVKGEAPEIIEVAGRLCYKSFKPGLNPNVSKVREGNEAYLENILKSGHGSVLEHGEDGFAFVGVSRVFTHELVRHRLASYSQESLRFVRLDDLVAYYPKAFEYFFLYEVWDSLSKEVKECILEADGGSRETWAKETSVKLKDEFLEVFKFLEDKQKLLAEILHLDDIKDFSVKKKLTSAMRRLAPIGLGTAIIMTANHRTWRHIIEMRTSRHAEEEVREVFLDVFRQLRRRYPTIYQDANIVCSDDGWEITFGSSKI